VQAGRDHDRYSMFLNLGPLYRLFAGFYLGYALPRGNDVECHSHYLLPLVYCCLPIHPHACLTLYVFDGKYQVRFRRTNRLKIRTVTRRSDPKSFTWRWRLVLTFSSRESLVYRRQSNVCDSTAGH
jgi:hypothetical protein